MYAYLNFPRKLFIDMLFRYIILYYELMNFVYIYININIYIIYIYIYYIYVYIYIYIYKYIYIYINEPV